MLVAITCLHRFFSFVQNKRKWSKIQKTIFWDSCMLRNLLLGEINKFVFQFFCKISLEKDKTTLTFAYEFTRIYPVSQFLDSQNSKWEYKSRKILVFARNSGFHIFFHILH
jgi:hypothetical protein